MDDSLSPISTLAEERSLETGITELQMLEDQQ
jgi:hypothetical protein